MPSEEDLSPEERLLKVIQQTKPGKEKDPVPRRPAPVKPAARPLARAGVAGSAGMRATAAPVVGSKPASEAEPAVSAPAGREPPPAPAPAAATAVPSPHVSPAVAALQAKPVGPPPAARPVAAGAIPRAPVGAAGRVPPPARAVASSSSVPQPVKPIAAKALVAEKAVPAEKPAAAEKTIAADKAVTAGKTIGAEKPVAAERSAVAEKPVAAEKSVAAGKAAAPASTRAGLAAPEKRVRHAPVPRQFGSALSVPIGKPADRGREGGGGAAFSIGVVNRLLGAACVLLFVGVALEMRAAKPVLPEAPDNLVDTPVVLEVNPPGQLTEYVGAVRKRDIWDFVDAGTAVSVARPDNAEAKFLAVMRCAQEKLQVEGVSLQEDDPAGSFAAVTVKGKNGALLRYLKPGNVVSIGDVPSAGETELVLEKIGRDALFFSYEGRTVELSGRR